MLHQALARGLCPRPTAMKTAGAGEDSSQDEVGPAGPPEGDEVAWPRQVGRRAASAKGSPGRRRTQIELEVEGIAGATGDGEFGAGAILQASGRARCPAMKRRVWVRGVWIWRRMQVWPQRARPCARRRGSPGRGRSSTPMGLGGLQDEVGHRGVGAGEDIAHLLLALAQRHSRGRRVFQTSPLDHPRLALPAIAAGAAVAQH